MAEYAVRPDIPARGAVVYVPGVGGRTAVVQNWARPGGRPVAAAIWKRPAEPGTVVERGRELVAALREKNVEEVLLVGHSLGALIAFEAAVAAPELAVRLVLAAQYPPHVMRRYSQRELEELAVLDELAASMPAELAGSAEFRALMRDVWKKEYRMIEEYQASGRTAVPISVIGAEGDVSSRDFDRLKQWAEHASGPVSTHLVAGAHNFVELLSGDDFEHLLRETCR
jgi:surfactin synthase thioesterase subunit